MAKDKSRYFTFLLYPESIPDDWKSKLELIGVPIAVSPLHDKDKSTVPGQDFKKPHYHVVYVAKNPVTADSVRYKIKQLLGDQSIAKVQIVIRSMTSMYLYLTHESKDAIEKKKHKYNKQDITLINNFDVDRYVTLDESEKKELRQTLLEIIDKYKIVNIIELSAFIRERGNEFGIDGMRYVNEVISSTSGIFRLYFDANYQCGYRPVYSKTIDPETGEMR